MSAGRYVVIPEHVYRAGLDELSSTWHHAGYVADRELGFPETSELDLELLVLNTRSVPALADALVWRANWMTRAVNLLGALRNAVEAEWPEHLDELEELLADEYDDGELDDDDEEARG